MRRPVGPPGPAARVHGLSRPPPPHDISYPTPAGADETAELVDASPDDADLDFPEGYARAKAGGELAAVAAFGEWALLTRAGLILGPYENVGRLPWWLGRIAHGGPVPAPGPADVAVQHIDVRDLAAWMLDAAVQRLAGPFDLVCPVGHTTMGDVLDACVAATGSNAELCWTAPETILAAGIQPWTGLPIWLPPGEMHDALHGCDVSKALAAGLRCRPVTPTVADAWAWLQTSMTGRPSVPTAHRSGSTPTSRPASLWNARRADRAWRAVSPAVRATPAASG